MLFLFKVSYQFEFLRVSFDGQLDDHRMSPL